MIQSISSQKTQKSHKVKHYEGYLTSRFSKKSFSQDFTGESVVNTRHAIIYLFNMLSKMKYLCSICFY